VQTLVATTVQAMSTEEPLADLLRRVVVRVQDLVAAEERVRALLDAVTVIGGDLDLHATLQRVIVAAARLAGARYVALGVLDSSGDGLSDFITYGVDDDQRAAIGALPRGHGILGLLITDPRPLRLHDLKQHEQSYGFPPNHPPMNTFLGVPVRGRGGVFGNLYLTEKEGGGDFTDDDERAVVALANAAGIAIENARLFEETHRRERWLEATADIHQSLLHERDRSVVLDLVASTGREVAGADLALIVLESDDGPLKVEAVSGNPDLLEAELPRTGPLVDVLDHGATVRLASGVPLPGVAQARQALLVPFTGPGGVGGALVVATTSSNNGVWPLDDEVEAMRGFAAQAAIALDRAQAREDREALAVFSDRDRIARDLHDLVIQRLFATGLSLQGSARLVAKPEIQARIHASVDDLDATIRDIRSTIFALSHDHASADLRSQLREVVASAAPNLAKRPHLTIDGPVDSSVPENLRPHLLAVVVESLSNAARHAHATAVDVRVAVKGGQVVLEVADDGRGFTPNGRESGLANMRTRAEQVGGRCEVESVVGVGTTVRWSAPLVSVADGGRSE
jgi:signal transduction histidine kinase